MDAPFITIATYQNTMKAELAKSLLEAEGIRVYLHNLNIVQADWLLANAVGSIKLQVPAADCARAEQLLYDLPDNKAPADATFEEVYCLSCGGAMDEDQDHCDSCGWSYEADVEYE